MQEFITNPVRAFLLLSPLPSTARSTVIGTASCWPRPRGLIYHSQAPAKCKLFHRAGHRLHGVFDESMRPAEEKLHRHRLGIKRFHDSPHRMYYFMFRATHKYQLETNYVDAAVLQHPTACNCVFDRVSID